MNALSIIHANAFIYIPSLSSFISKFTSTSKASAIWYRISNEKLLPLLKNKITCLAGQSAVGKSSLCNALTGSDCFEEGELSEKIMRGKNTTTLASLVKISEGTFIVDTPGFSMLDVFDVTADELDLYYDEYVEISGDCKYHRCTHVAEPDCEVKRKVASGELSSERYERYNTLYETLKNAKKY